MFRNHSDAGQRLAKELMRFKDEDPVVLARPRNGVPVAYEVASAMGAPLDIVLVRRIESPDGPGEPVGSVVGPRKVEVYVNEPGVQASGVPLEYVDAEAAQELQEMQRQRQLYLGDREGEPLKGRTVIVVADGMASGATTRAVLRNIRHCGPRKLILAVPAAPRETVDRMRPEADEIVALEVSPEFKAVSAFYENYDQTSDAEVRHFLDLGKKH